MDRHRKAVRGDLASCMAVVMFAKGKLLLSNPRTKSVCLAVKAFSLVGVGLLMDFILRNGAMSMGLDVCHVCVCDSMDMILVLGMVLSRGPGTVGPAINPPSRCCLHNTCAAQDMFYCF